MLYETSPIAGRHTAPATEETHTDFPWDELAERMGESEPSQVRNDRSDMALALAKIFDWILDVQITRSTAPSIIGRRFVALVWTMDPGRFDNGSLAKLAAQLGLTTAQLSELSADASRVFKISNQYQDHDSKGQ